jgi:thiamine pyrophosphate-dependent acetolactate synthase large subunit-like protein
MVNEQIKEIMRQACKQSMRPESVLEDVPQDVLAKFAELIVKECIDVVEDAGGIDKYHYTGAIGKHFGVE